MIILLKITPPITIFQNKNIIISYSVFLSTSQVPLQKVVTEPVDKQLKITKLYTKVNHIILKQNRITIGFGGM